MNPAEAVMVVAIIVSLAWWLSLALWPWKDCPRCGGGKRIAPRGGGVHRDCGRCGATGRVRRFGAGKEG